MLFGSQPAVGLDIGSSVVKAVQIRRSGTNIELEKVGIAPVYPDGEKSGDAVKAKVEAIKRALADGQIKTKQAVTSVNGEAIIVRYLQLPNMPDDELRSALRFEAEEYIPFNLDECYLDSHILGRTTDEGGAQKVDVLLVATRKDMIHDHSDMVRQAGIQPVIVDLDAFAFYNCFEVNYHPTGTETIALVNIGAQITNINIYSEGASRFSRDISIAGDGVTTAIKNKLTTSFREAEETKLRNGLPQTQEAAPAPVAERSLLDTIRGTVEKITGEAVGDETPDAMAAAVTRDTISALALELRRSVQFFENQLRAKSIERVLLGGGSAKMRNIETFLSQELKIPVELFDPLRRISPAGRSLNATLISENKIALGVSLGLALRKLGA
ncbi:MAG: type IV pilus assembly protein PilM [Candidatus Sumerlaeota bacterium]|nr:type IV pilus assembly protein PilM [Candidatus Sumerlaeota bacterium]